VEFQGLFTGEVAAKGGVKDDLQRRRLLGGVWYPGLSIRTEPPALYLTSGEHHDFSKSNHRGSLQTGEVLL